MALEQRIDEIDHRIDELEQKLEALQKGASDNILELKEKCNAKVDDLRESIQKGSTRKSTTYW